MSKKTQALPVTKDGGESVPQVLTYQDPDHTGAILSQLAKLYKRGQFCDATLILGDNDTPVHRAVLASASTFFFDLFMRGMKAGDDGSEERKQHVFKLKDIPWETFRYLLDFMYTGRLTVEDEDVAAVYRLAQELRVPRASEACAQYLIQHLTPDNCLGIRAFAADNNFRQSVDLFINSNIKAVTNSKKFYRLNKVTLEIVGTDETVVMRTNHDNILPEVLVWLREKMATKKNKLDSLMEDLIILYLNVDGQLTDCAEVEDTNLKENGLVQDYKKLNKKKQSGQVQTKGLGVIELNGAGSNYRKFSINPEKPIVEKEWSIIATHKAKDRTYITIAMLNGNLVSLTIHYRPAANPDSVQSDPDSPVHEPADSFVELTPLAKMSANRCAFGMKALNGKLFACGGYDRGEIFKSSEVYDPTTNQWRAVGEMKSPRGRFSIALYQDKVYACGGSSGNSEVKIVECYDPETEKWKIVMNLPQGKASPGVAVLEGKLYVLGGCIGQSTVATCQACDLATGQWENIPNMKIQRYQIAVTVLDGKIYAIGGTNGWKCLNDVEVFDQKTKKWTFLPPMNVTRRGAGVDTYKGKIIVVGGNDGTAALNSIEIYDPATDMWQLGPNLNLPRANCGVACLSSRLYTVGGYTGKSFLQSMEVLDLETLDKWSCYLPISQPNKLVKQVEVVTNVADEAEKPTTNGVESSAAEGEARNATGDAGNTDLKTVQVEGTGVCNSNLPQDIKLEGERPS